MVNQVRLNCLLRFYGLVFIISVSYFSINGIQTMSNPPSAQFSLNDYDAIEAAVGSSERGRWFLTEFAKRNRVSDTQTVMSAIEKLQNAVVGSLSSAKPVVDTNNIVVETLRNDLIEMAHRIADTQNEVTAIGLLDSDPQHIELVSGELDAITRSIEHATSEILESAEEIQEIAWTLREGGLAVETCDALDARSTKIYLACSFQDLTAQRTNKVVETMRFLENRINKMIGILQGVEGFEISDSYESEQKPQPNLQPKVMEPNLVQADVDFALNWGYSQGEDKEPGIENAVKISDNWIEESEIEANLSPAPQTNKNINSVVFEEPELKSAEISHFIAKPRVSKLDELDQKTLDEKLSLFT